MKIALKSVQYRYKIELFRKFGSRKQSGPKADIRGRKRACEKGGRKERDFNSDPVVPTKKCSWKNREVGKEIGKLEKSRSWKVLSRKVRMIGISSSCDGFHIAILEDRA